MLNRKIFQCAVVITILMTSACVTRGQLTETQQNSGDVAKMDATPVQGGGYGIEELKAEQARENGRIEELERGANSSNWKDSDDYKALVKRVDDLEKAQLESLEAIKKLQANQPPADNTGLVEQAKKAFNAGDYSNATDLLTQYLQNPSGKLAEDAYFLRGESLFRQKIYKKAILDYANFPDKFNKSPLYPKALLKIGLAYEALSMKDEAKAFFQDLIEKFPKSHEAKEAKKHLK